MLQELAENDKLKPLLQCQGTKRLHVPKKDVLEPRLLGQKLHPLLIMVNTNDLSGYGGEP